MLLLKNGLTWIGGKLQKADMLINKGKIVKITKGFIFDSKQIKSIDCKDKLIIPGIIDCHVHFRDLGQKYKEDYESGSRAAVAGGVTTIFDMPNTSPPMLTVKVLNLKRKIAKKSMLCNYGFHFGCGENNIAEIKKAKGVPSTKIYMNDTTGHLKVEKEEKIEKIFRASKMCMVHAEEDTQKLAVKIAKKTKKKLHVAHMTCKSEVDYIRKIKNKKITCEVTPHHLYLHKTKDPFLLVKPSLKTKKDNEALWRALRSGIIDTIGSDHAPHTIKEKKSKSPPWGMPGVETSLPLMLDAVNKKKITLKRMINAMCEIPVKIFKIKNKGFIKEGYDADITIVDMNLTKKIDSGKLHSKCGWSPFNSWKLKGWPIMTIINGNIVYEKEKFHLGNFGKEVEYDS